MPLNLSLLYEEASRRSMTQVFYGLNKNLRSGEGEFFDMKNLTSDHAPLLAVRERRYEPKDFGANKPIAIVAGVGAAETSMTRGLCWIDESGVNSGDLIIGDKAVPIYVRGYIPTKNGGGQKKIVKMGAYLIIIPDMIYVNTVDTGDNGKIVDKYTNMENQFRLAVCDSDGEIATYVLGEEPLDPYAGETWHKTGENPNLYRYDDKNEEWYEITSYLKLTVHRYLPEGFYYEQTNFSLKKPLRAGDTVKISGIDTAINGKKKVMKVDIANRNEDDISALYLQGIISYPISIVASSENPVTIERVIPKLDFVCEAGNRLWGCRYGDDGHGNFVNEIYCSARGDFYRWIAGEATDEDAPVTFSIGTDGNWTGCVNYGGVPTFFKDNTMYRVGGYGASGFALQEMPCMGVQAGAARSLAVVNNVLYYKSAAGVMAYDGSVPVNVSDKLGRLSRYNNAVGGACGEKYYISMWRTDGEGNTYDPVLYALDTEKGLWHKEDEIECESMASDVDNLYFVEMGRRGDTVTHTIKAVRIPDDVDASAHGESSMIPWYAETGIIGLESPDAKYVSRLAIRMHLDAGATVRVLVQYDSSGYWKQIAGTEAATMRTVTMPVIPARCDHMRLRLEGVGGCKVYSITKTVENGEEA